MNGWLTLKDGYRKLWKNATVTYFKVLSQYLLGGTTKNLQGCGLIIHKNG
jgi:hypothetical protein